MTGENNTGESTGRLPASAETLILGGGLTGLTAAREIRKSGGSPIVLEKAARPGGLLKTNREGGVAIDELPHVFFTKDKIASKLFRDIVGPVHGRKHKLGVLWKGGYVDFPFQNHINQLDLADRKLALRGLLELGDGKSAAEARNLEEFALRTLGRGIVDLFFRPYNEKLWRTPLAGMDYEWLASKIKLPDAEALADSVLGGPSAGRGDVAPHAEFIYPRKGGIESLAEGLAARLAPGALFCGAGVLSINTARRVVSTSRGDIRYGKLISTLPLDRLIELSGSRDCVKLAPRLRATKVLCLQYVLKSVNLPDYHWIYVPDRKLPFYRFTRVDLFNPGAAAGRMVLLVECAVPSSGGAVSDGATAARVTGLLRGMGIIPARALERSWHTSHFPAYPVPHAGHGRDVPACLKRLGAAGIISAGRFGEWAMYNMDHSIRAGLAAAGEAQGS